LKRLNRHYNIKLPKPQFNTKKKKITKLAIMYFILITEQNYRFFTQKLKRSELVNDGIEGDQGRRNRDIAIF
jgi:hypothetical protein